MKDSFTIDLKSYPLEKYLEVLKEMDFIPSRRILKEDTVRRFALLKNEGFDDLEQLSEGLKSPEKVAALAEKTGIPNEFLTILKREMSGLNRPPALLKEFPGVDSGAVGRLEQGGIKNARQFFEAALTKEGRASLAEKFGMDTASVLDLTKLCDVSRLYGVGPVFARMLVESGCDTTAKIARCDPPSLFEKLMRINDAKGYTQAKFRVQDMEYCRNFAKNFPDTDNYAE